MTATLQIIDSPLSGAGICRSIPAGVRICDLVPVDAGAMVCVDSQWVLRGQWGYRIQDGETLEIHFLPGGNDARKALRLALTIAATVAFGPTGLGAGEFGITAATSATLTLAASAAINILLPFKQPNIGGGATAGSPTYDAALTGNRAALDQPIPVIYGRMRHFPPFAADPYAEIDNDTQDSYYHALLCVGMGHYTFEALQIDDTEIDAFADVQYNVLPPGTAPTLVLPNVVTSTEVADFPLNAGRSTPAINACRGGLTATAVGVDVVFPGGLGDATGSSVTSKSVTIRFDVRAVDDYGVPLASWSVLGTEVITAASTEPVRRSFKYTLGTAARVQVRAVRTTARDDDPLVRNDPFWTGLRAYLDVSAPLASGATYVEVRMRATEQLNGLTQRRLAVIVRRLLHTWDEETGWSATRTFTRSPAWAIVDKLRNADYGNGLPDGRIDLATFASLAATWAARQDHLDVVIDTTTDSDEADQIMARPGRARCVWRNGVRTIVRDELQTLEAAAFTGRDIAPGSVSLSYATDASRIPDAIIVEYFAHLSWQWESITCKAPGVSTATRPEYLRLLGITGAKQAEREGLYEAAARALRRKATTFTTELQGLIPAYGSLVRVGLPLRGYGQHGDVVSYDSGALELVLTEPLTWTASVDHYITLVRPDGSVHDAILVTEGADAYTVVLDEAPDFDPITDDARRERTRFIFGNTTEHRRTALVLGIRPQDMRDDGAILVEVSCINDAAAIHSADNALLPVGDEVQDPIDSPNTSAGGGGGGEAIIPYLLSKDVYGTSSDELVAPGLTVDYRNDGVLRVTDTAPSVVTNYADEWVLGDDIDPATEGVLYEIRFTRIDGNADQITTTATFDTWLNLDTTRAIEVTPNGWVADVSSFARITVQIREVSTGFVQASHTITTWLQGATSS
jgi:hypothetical protein